MKTPTAYADEQGAEVVQRLSARERKEFGVFFTPEPIARFMSSRIGSHREEVRLLDPAAGSGILACSAIEELVHRANPPKHISVVAFEIRQDIYEALQDSLEYAKEWARVRGVKVTLETHCADYVASYATNPIVGMSDGSFDLVIANPPYFKLGSKDSRFLALADAIPNQPNIYSMFMTLAARELRLGGDLVFIVPRSFASGIYFKPFRKWFFRLIQLESMHLFGSRRQAFKRDAVLQENVIISGERVESSRIDKEITLTHSEGINDLESPERWTSSLAELYELRSPDLLLRMPSSLEDMQILKQVDSLPSTLSSMGLSISTGPVVAFRAWDFIADEPGETAIPLLWLHHIKPGEIQWPVENRSNQYLREPVPKLVVNRQNMVVIRRFSAKDEQRRLTAAPLLGEQFDYPYIGLENHLNYIYRRDGSLGNLEAIGLAAILNSSLMDKYFRSVSGNTQVGAAELRHLPLPNNQIIEGIGQMVIQDQATEQDVEDMIFHSDFLLTGD